MDQDIHDSVPARDVHQRFLDAPGDAYAIMQLKQDAPRELHYSALDRIPAPPAPSNYDVIYTGPIVCEQSQMATLERLYPLFVGVFLPHIVVRLHINTLQAVPRDDVELSDGVVVLGRVARSHHNPAIRHTMSTKNLVLQKLQHCRGQGFRHAVDEVYNR